MVAQRRQINNDHIYWRIYAQSNVNELKEVCDISLALPFILSDYIT